MTCFIRDDLDPFQGETLRAYAERWASSIPRCGEDLLGDFLPHEGTRDEARGPISFDSLASLRAKLRDDLAPGGTSRRIGTLR